jgi:beta-glucanase (GH16 family)
MFVNSPLILCLAAATLVSPWRSLAQFENSWHLVWADEFDVDGAPNPAYWGFENGFVRNEELQWYQPENAWVQGGALIIEGRREQVLNPNYDPGSTDWRKNRQYAEYTSASLRTRGKFSWQYGRLEVRARIPAQLGMWPAIWTLGTWGEWPSNGECDVMEYYPKSGQPAILANAAWGTATRWVAQWDGAHRFLSHYRALDPDWESKFHVWTMDWDENSIRLSLDGELINFVDLSQTINGSDGLNPFHRPHYLLLNLAIGSTGGDPSGSTFPDRYEIDYVRVYEATSPADLWVKLNDTDGAIDYSSGWGTYAGNAGYLRDEHFSETTGAAATLSFTGTKARFHGFKRNDLGHAEILIDGVSQGMLDCYQDRAEYDVLLYETPDLAYGDHTLTVRVAGSKNPVSTGTEVIVDAFAWLAWAKVNDDDPAVSYSANWGFWPAASGSLGTGYHGDQRYSWTTSATATYSFTGIQGRYYGFMRDDLGHAEVFIDGVSQGLIDCYSATTRADTLLFETPALPHGNHTMSVRVTGDKNPASSGTEVIVDAFASLAGIPIPTITRAWFEGNDFHVEVSNLVPGTTYSLRRDTDLATAPTFDSVVDTQTALAGTEIFTDTNALSAFGHAFYRISD